MYQTIQEEEMNNVTTIAKKKMNPLLEALLILEDRVQELEEGRQSQIQLISELIQRVENLQDQINNKDVPPV